MTDVIYYVKGREYVFKDIIPSEADELLSEYGPSRVFLFGNRDKGNQHVPLRIWIDQGIHIPKIAKSVTKQHVAKQPKVKHIVLTGSAPIGRIEWYSGDIHVPEYSNRGVRQDEKPINTLLIEG